MLFIIVYDMIISIDKGAFIMPDFEIMNGSLYDDSLPMKILEQAFEMQVEQAEKATNKLVSDVLKLNNMILINYLKVKKR